MTARYLLISFSIMQMDMEASSAFSEAFDFASGAIGERFQNPFWNFTEIFCGAKFRAAIAEVKRYGRSIVAVTVQKGLEKQAEESNGEKNRIDDDESISGSLIKLLMEGIDDHEIVADAALNYLSAGTSSFLPPSSVHNH